MKPALVLALVLVPRYQEASDGSDYEDPEEGRGRFGRALSQCTFNGPGGLL